MTLPTPYASGRDWVLYHGDCLDILPRLEAGSVDAVVTDPPYGMRHNTDSTRFTGGIRAPSRGDGRSDWSDIHGDDRPFDPTPWLGFPKVVLFGYHHFAQRLPVGTVLAWIKKGDHLFGTFLSDAELAWMKGGHGVYCYRKQFPPPSRMHENDGEVAHPTQKPIGLMEWCLERAKVPETSIVLDPFTGSGTTGVACIRTGRKFIGIEIDEHYCEVAAKRMQRAEDDQALFTQDEPKPEQLTLEGAP